MIYLLYGNDFKKSREKLHSLVNALLNKEPNASQFWIDGENFSEDFLNEVIQSQALFFNKNIVVLDKICENKDFEKIILYKIKSIADSPNIFLFIEEELSKTTLSKFKKWAAKIQEFQTIRNKQALTKNESFNIFSITDAFGERDGRVMWVIYQKALSFGISPEEIHGILFWQIKNLLMVKDESDTKSLGLNPFVLRKSLSAVKKFKKSELVTFSRELVEIPHRSRRGLEDFDISLEKFILSI